MKAFKEVLANSLLLDEIKEKFTSTGFSGCMVDDWLAQCQKIADMVKLVQSKISSFSLKIKSGIAESAFTDVQKVRALCLCHQMLVALTDVTVASVPMKLRTQCAAVKKSLQRYEIEPDMIGSDIVVRHWRSCLTIGV